MALARGGLEFRNSSFGFVSDFELRVSDLKATLLNRQRRVPLDIAWLRRAAALALPKCAALSDDGRFALREIAEINVAIVSDAAMARLHLDFMGIAGPTDVLTFEHGEIAISAETARDFASRFGRAVEIEIALYTIHGFLHLNGFDDRRVPAAARMRRAQARVLRAVRAELPPP